MKPDLTFGLSLGKLRSKGNTVGSRGKLTKEDLAYIAGFLDGDGCIMLQLINRHDYMLGYQIRASIVFYQKTCNREFLEWLKSALHHGYIRNRPDGMSEYTIVGVTQVKEVLLLLIPFVRLKRKQAKLALKILKQMPGKGEKMTPQLLYKLAPAVDQFRFLNYSKKRTNTAKQVKDFLLSHNFL